MTRTPDRHDSGFWLTERYELSDDEEFDYKDERVHHVVFSNKTDYNEHVSTRPDVTVYASPYRKDGTVGARTNDWAPDPSDLPEWLQELWAAYLQRFRLAADAFKAGVNERADT